MILLLNIFDPFFVLYNYDFPSILLERNINPPTKTKNERLSRVFSLFSAVPIILAFDPPGDRAIVRETVTEAVCETVYVTVADTPHGVDTLAAQYALSKSTVVIQSWYQNTLRKEATDFNS